MQKIVLFVLRGLEKISGKRFVYVPKNRKVAGKTAVKSDDGFWYVGDVTDTHDLAYGILYNGSVEKEETSLVKRVLQKMLGAQAGLNFYDVGANTGYYGIMAAFLGNKTVKTFSFEPLSDCAWSIEQSAQLNNLQDHIKVFRTALGSTAGSATLFVSGSGSTLHKDFLGRPDAPEQTVLVQTLDEIIEKNNLPAPDFIKIDVEGHELSVLQGGQKILGQHKPIMFIEIAKTLKNLGRKFINEEFDKTFKMLTSLGYDVLCLEGAKLFPVDENYHVDGVHMFLCVPKAKAALLQEVLAK